MAAICPILPPILEGPSPRELGAKIRRARRRQGVTQDVLASAVGVTTRTLQNWEAGKTEARYPTIRKIADFLGVPAAEIAGELPPTQVETLLEQVEAVRADVNRLLLLVERVLDEGRAQGGPGRV